MTVVKDKKRCHYYLMGKIARQTEYYGYRTRNKHRTKSKDEVIWQDSESQTIVNMIGKKKQGNKVTEIQE